MNLVAGLFDTYPKASRTKMIAGLFDAYSLLKIGTYKPSSVARSVWADPDISRHLAIKNFKCNYPQNEHYAE